MNEQVLITVCGRAGSKGFKNKNLKSLLGLPLINYTLTCADYFKRNVKNANVDICINTDSEDLISLATATNIPLYIINRPIELCGDTVGKFEVFRHCLKTMEQKLQKHYDYVIDFDLTSPLRTLDDALSAFELLRANKEAELTITGCSSRRNPYFNMVEQRGVFVEKVINLPIEARQQAPQVFDMNASIYILRTAFMRDPTKKMILDAKTVLYKMYDTAVLDIDSEEDFELMEIIAKYLFLNNEKFSEMFNAVQKTI